MVALATFARAVELSKLGLLSRVAGKLAAKLPKLTPLTANCASRLAAAGLNAAAAWAALAPMLAWPLFTLYGLTLDMSCWLYRDEADEALLGRDCQELAALLLLLLLLLLL